MVRDTRGRGVCATLGSALGFPRVNLKLRGVLSLLLCSNNGEKEGREISCTESLRQDLVHGPKDLLTSLLKYKGAVLK